MNSKEFSVLMSVYHRDNSLFLQEALVSILNQSLAPSEIVLVQDGPLNEDLYKCIQKYQSEFPGLFKIINLEKNGGLGNALKIGLAECSFEFVARMDSDDISTYERFEMEYEFLASNPDYALVGSNIEEFDKIPGDLKRYRMVKEKSEDIIRQAKFRSPVNHPSIMFRKSRVIEVGSYDTSLLLWEDYTLFIKMLNKGFKFYNIQQSLLFFRVGNGIETIKRRSGIKYAINEIRLANFAKKINFFSGADYLRYILIKPPGRMLPRKIILYIYNSLFRQKNIK